MRVLIIGASGLIGGRLIKHLMESSNAQVRAASRIARKWPDGIEGCVTDIGLPSSLSSACRDVDTVINLASMPERLCTANPWDALCVNVGGTLAWATAAVQAGVTRFVQLSTYKVYGNNPSGSVTEEMLTKPQSHYALTHRAAEDYAMSLHPHSVVFRLANGFGEPVDPIINCWDLIVNGMCREAATERRITIRSSGRIWRNFVPMQDVVGALRWSAMDLISGTYNLGSAYSMTLSDVAARVARVCEDTLGFSPLVSVDATAQDKEHVRLDFRIDKLAAAGFNPAASFDKELDRTLMAALQMFSGSVKEKDMRDASLA